MNTSERLASLLAQLFSVAPEEAPQLSRNSAESWDSLRHIEVLYLLEEEFDFVPTPESVAELVSFEALLAALESAPTGA